RLRLRAQCVRVGHELARQLLVEQRDEQVLGVELRIAVPPCELLRGRDGLLGLDRQLREVHQVLSGSRSSRYSTRSRRYSLCTRSTSSRSCRCSRSTCACALRNSSSSRSTSSTPARL